MGQSVRLICNMGERDLPHRVVLKRVDAKRFARRLAQTRCPANIRPRAESIPALLTMDACKTALCSSLGRSSPLRTIYKTRHCRLRLGGMAENILPLDLVTHGKPVWGEFSQPHKYFPGSPLRQCWALLQTRSHTGRDYFGGWGRAERQKGG